MPRLPADFSLFEEPLPDDVPFPPDVLLFDDVVPFAVVAKEPLNTHRYPVVMVEDRSPPYPEHSTKLLPDAPSSVEVSPCFGVTNGDCIRVMTPASWQPLLKITLSAPGDPPL